MKPNMKRWMSFLTFDLPLETACITTEFNTIHHLRQQHNPAWSTDATRRELITRYWFGKVLRHFLMLLFLSILLTILLFQELSAAFGAAILFSGSISFLVILLFTYWPQYGYYFLPQLETAKKCFEQNESAKLEKCRQSQLSNLALTLVFYVFDKTSQLDALQPSDQQAALLVKLFGVDRGSLKGNLELLSGHPGKRKNWTDRKKTEIENRFQEACQFFQELNFPAGEQLLEELKVKLLKQ